MKKIVLGMISMGLFLLITPFSVKAADEQMEYTEGSYTYTVENEEATITGYRQEDTGDITLPATLGGYPVKAIGKSAFASCGSLKTLKIPEGIERIEEKAFQLCASLESVEIPETILEIRAYAFGGCQNLKAVYISDLAAWCQIQFRFDSSWGSEREEVFSNPLYAGKASLYLNKELVQDAVIPEGVTSIGNGAFAGCSSLHSVTMQEGLEKIGEKAFYQCGQLNRLAVPKSMKTIYDFDTFSGSEKVKEIYISDLEAWTSIQILNRYDGSAYREAKWHRSNVWGKGYNLYLNGELLKKFMIPDTDYFNGSIFTNCKSLTTLTFAEEIGNRGTEGISISGFWNCDGLTDLEFPEGIRVIDDGFVHCTSLVNVKFLQKVNTNGAYMLNSIAGFDRCTSLKSVEIPEGVKNICGFNECTSLEGVVIPEGVEYIMGFTGYKGVIKIPDSVTRIDDSSFGARSGNKNIMILCTENSAVYLFAVKYDLPYKILSKDAWTVTYDVNGGTQMPAMQMKEKGKPLTLRLDIPVREGYAFAGWKPKGKDAPIYQPGDIYTADEDIELEAIWQKAIKKGDINGDGMINLSDAIWLLNAVTNGTDLSMEVADVNGDGVINISDAIYLLNQITK